MAYRQKAQQTGLLSLSEIWFRLLKQRPAPVSIPSALVYVLNEFVFARIDRSLKEWINHSISQPINQSGNQ